MILFWALPWIQSGESTDTNHIVSQVVKAFESCLCLKPIYFFLSFDGHVANIQTFTVTQNKYEYMCFVKFKRLSSFDMPHAILMADLDQNVYRS